MVIKILLCLLLIFSSVNSQTLSWTSKPWASLNGSGLDHVIALEKDIWTTISSPDSSLMDYEIGNMTFINIEGDSMLVSKYGAGKYFVLAALNIDAVSGIFEMTWIVNGIPSMNPVSMTRVTGVSGGSLSIFCILILNQNDVVKIGLRNTQNDNDATIEYASLMMFFLEE